MDDIDTGVKYVISKDGKPGPVTTEFVRRLDAIRHGEEPDVHGWITFVE